MGNRILKESITTNAKLAKLSDFEFRLWVGLLTLADDYGCGDGRTVVIRNLVFATNPSVSVQQVARAMKKLEKVGCIRTYMADGQPYFWFPTWLEHQRLRHHTPKLPQPPELQAVIAQRREASARAAEKRKQEGRQRAYDYQPVYDGFEEAAPAEEKEEPAEAEAVRPASDRERESYMDNGRRIPAELNELPPEGAEPDAPEEADLPPVEPEFANLTGRECLERIRDYRHMRLAAPEGLLRRAKAVGLRVEYLETG